MDKLDRNKVISIVDDIKEALKILEEKHGVYIQYQGGVFNATHFRCKLLVGILKDDGAPEIRRSWPRNSMASSSATRSQRKLSSISFKELPSHLGCDGGGLK